jgi:micrococcal nuclease
MKKFLTAVSILLLSGSLWSARAGTLSVTNENSGTFGLVLSIPLVREYDYRDSVVRKVIDGDTIQLENGERVRLIGIDTPEVYQTKESESEAHRRGKNVEAIRALGKQASVFSRELMEGKRVRLEFDVERTDKYGRLLAYVYLDHHQPIAIAEANRYHFIYNGAVTSIFCNATIVKAGYAHPLTIPPNVKYTQLFRALSYDAHEKKRGLWK